MTVSVSELLQDNDSCAYRENAAQVFADVHLVLINDVALMFNFWSIFDPNLTARNPHCLSVVGKGLELRD